MFSDLPEINKNILEMLEIINNNNNILRISCNLNVDRLLRRIQFVYNFWQYQTVVNWRAFLRDKRLSETTYLQTNLLNPTC